MADNPVAGYRIAIYSTIVLAIRPKPDARRNAQRLNTEQISETERERERERRSISRKLVIKRNRSSKLLISHHKAAGSNSPTISELRKLI